MAKRLKRLGGVISPRWREPSTCAACGDEFSCGATLAGCWCSEVKLSEETGATLRSQYPDCLCRKCLEASDQLSPKFIEN